MNDHSPFRPGWVPDLGPAPAVTRMTPGPAEAPSPAALAELAARVDASTRARHCAQAQAGYYYCDRPGDPCGPGPYPHAGHHPGQCDVTGGAR